MDAARPLRPAAGPAAQRDFGRAGLRRYAGVWSLWALGVSAVIPGEYSGWSYGLITGGFGGMIVATLVVVVMYLGLCFSLAELAGAMPFAGGAYAYGRSALGPWGGFLAGLAQNIEYVLTAAAVVVSVGDSLDGFIFSLVHVHVPDIVLWAVAYAIFTAINVSGIRLTCQIAFLLTLVALGVLVYFAVGAVPRFELASALDVPIVVGNTPWLPNGLLGIAWSIPFAIWFLVVIEMVTLTAEETNHPQATLPRGLLYGIGTLVVAALVVLFLNPAIPPGAKAVGDSTQPLMLALDGIIGGELHPAILALFALASYVAGFHATIYAYGRSIYALSRAGYIPSWLSAIHGVRRTPHMALLAGGTIGLLIAVLMKYAFPHQHVDAVLLHMAVLAAIASYLLQMLSFLVLRRGAPQMARPFVSPLGATGAMTALVIAAVAAGLMFLDPAYRVGLIGIVVIYSIGIAYFLLSRRRPNAAAPEEQFAIEQGR